MKNVSEQRGKNVEEAIRKALDELKVSREDVKIEVLEEASSGAVSFLSAKPARVRVTVNKKVNVEVIEATKAEVTKFMEGYLAVTTENIEYKINDENGFVTVEITGEDAGVFVGYKGALINDLQTIINAHLAKSEEEYAKVSLDVNNYKKNKEEILKKLANKMASNVVRFKKIIKLEPMSAYERKIIHTELQNHPQVETESIGEEPRRRVIIKLKRS